MLKIPPLRCIRSDWRLSAIIEFWISLTAMAAVPSLILLYGVLTTSISYLCVPRENIGRKSMRVSKNCLQSIVLVFFATYPFISANIFQVLPSRCHKLCTAKENGKCLNMMSYLRNNYSVKCPSTTGHNKFNANYAFVSLLLSLVYHAYWCVYCGDSLPGKMKNG